MFGGDPAYLLICTFCLLAIPLAPSTTSYQRVRTKYGIVRGRVETKGTISIKTFKGIPFAAAPVKNLRFMPPVTVAPWKQVLDALDFSPVCHQELPDISNSSNALNRMSRARVNYLHSVRDKLKNQSEDCLYLNVYIPVSGSEASRLPVVLFIHGDSFSWGSGNLYDGSGLAAFGNIVVVTINYRLGVLGFLNVNNGKSGGPATKVPSNLGILDQIAALHWIQENIQDFGGDKNNVTVLGHGTGAACLHFLMTSDALPHGLLFRRVILMSGSALAPWARAGSPRNTSRSLAMALNCPPSPPSAVIECLRKVSISDLMDQSEKLSKSGETRFDTVYGPSYDGIVVTSFKNKIGEYVERMARYDMILGSTSGEGYILLNNDELELGLETENRNQLVTDLVTSTYSTHQKGIISAILTEYTDWSNPNRQPINTRDLTVEAMTDGLYVAPGVETADYHASLNKNSWFYVFDYQARYGPYPQRLGCVHGEELPFVLGYPLLGDYYGNFTRQEQQLAEVVMTYWTNFIISGNPNYPHTTDREPKGKFGGMENWTPYDPKYKKYLQIGPRLKIKDQYRARRTALWLNLIPDLLHSGGTGTSGNMDGYLTYQETLPFIPNIKDISLMNEKTRPALLESQPSATLVPPTMVAITPSSSQQNESVFGLEGRLTSYSTALSVTIAIGTSLLILNIIIFAAVYYQRDKNKAGSRYSLSNSSECAPVNLTQPVGSHPPSLSGSINGSTRSQSNQSRRQSCRLSYSTLPGSAQFTGTTAQVFPGAGTQGFSGAVANTAAYLPPAQFADGQNSECSDSFSMSGVIPIGISTLPRRCHQGLASDTQPLIVGSSFRGGAGPPSRQDVAASYHQSMEAKSYTSTHRMDQSPGTQTLPLKSSLKKPTSMTSQSSRPDLHATESKPSGSLEELRV